MRRNEFSKAASRQDGVGPGGSLFNVEESSSASSSGMNRKRRRWSDEQLGNNTTPMTGNHNDQVILSQNMSSKWDTTPVTSNNVSSMKSRWDETPILKASVPLLSDGTVRSAESSGMKKRSRWDETPTPKSRQAIDNSVGSMDIIKMSESTPAATPKIDFEIPAHIFL